MSSKSNSSRSKKQVKSGQGERRSSREHHRRWSDIFPKWQGLQSDWAEQLLSSMSAVAEGPRRPNFWRRPLLAEGLEDRRLLAADVYVNDAWSTFMPNEDPDGTGPATAIGVDAFTSIQAGIDAVDLGGTVTVFESSDLDGKYDEAVSVDKNLTLQGAPGETVVIDGSLGGPDEGVVTIVSATATDITIANLTLQNSAQRHGIRAVNSDLLDLTVDQVTATGNSDYGVAVSGIDSLTISDSVFNLNGVGGVGVFPGAMGVSAVTISGSDFSGQAGTYDINNAVPGLTIDASGNYFGAASLTDASAVDIVGDVDFTPLRDATLGNDDLYVHELGGQATATGRINEANSLVNPGGVVHVQTGSYGEDVVVGDQVLSPGSSPGVVTLGGLSLGSNSTLLMEIDGTNAATPDFDQFIVDTALAGGGSGGVGLDGTLNIDFGYIPAIGDAWQLISNDGVDPVSGTFASLLGTLPGGGSVPLTINYAGGDGNDVVLGVTNFSVLYAGADALTLDADNDMSGDITLGDEVSFSAPGEPSVSGLLFGYQVFNTITDALAVADDADQINAAGIELLEDDPAFGIDVATSPFTVDSFGVTSGFDGSLILDTGAMSFTYTPAADDSGVDIFNYIVTDGSQSITGTVWVNVTAVNDAPTFSLGAVPVLTEGDGPQSLPGFATFSRGPADESGQSVTFTVTPDAVDATLTFAAAPAISASGDLTFEADEHAFGTGTFEVVLMDDGGTANGGVDTSITQFFTITVNGVNDAPTGVADSYTVDEDETLMVDAPGVLANDVDLDGDDLTAVLVTDVTNGVLTLNPDGSFEYIPEPNFNGTDSFEYRANDGTVDSDVVTVTITVVAVNDPPVAIDDTISVDEDSSVMGDVSTNDSDVDMDVLTYSLNTGPAHGMLTLNSDGTFTYTPEADYFGPDSFTYDVTDGTDTDTATVNITVNPVQDPVVAVDDAYTATEDTVLTVAVGMGVLANDIDPDSDTLTAFLLSQPPAAEGNVVLNSNGSFTFTPAADFNGATSFSYLVTDGINFDTATVSITVEAVNDAPAFSLDAGPVLNEDDGAQSFPGFATFSLGPANESGQSGTFTVTPNAVDATLTFTTPPTISPTTGELTFETAANAFGSGTFNVVLMDDGGTANGGVNTSTTQSFTITVNEVNDLPTAGDDSAEIAEDTASGVVIDVLANDDDDIDGMINSASVMIDSPPTDGSVSVDPVTGAITYTPDADFFGTDTFTYQVADDDGGVATATVTVTVMPVNDAPIANDDIVSIDEDSGPITIDVLANDAPGPINESGQSLTLVGFTGFPGAAAGTLSVVGGQLVYSPALNYSGTFSVTYTTRDNGQTQTTVDDPPADDFLESTATLTVTVNPISDMPLLVVADASGDEDMAIPLSITAALSDPSETLSLISISGVPIGAVLSAGTDVGGGVWEVAAGDLAGLTITPPLNENGMFTLGVEVASEDAPDLPALATGSITVTVAAVNDAPVVTVPLSESTDEDTPLAITSVSVSDADVDETMGGELKVTVSVTSGTIALGATTGATVIGDGSAVVTIIGLPADVNSELSSMIYTPDADFFGTDTMSVEANDLGNTGSGGALLGTGNFDITVNAVNDAPTADDDTVMVDEDSSFNFDVRLNDMDVDGTVNDATVVVVVGSGPSDGSVVINADGTVTYTPDPNFNGTDSFDYTIIDDQGAVSNEATVNITVNPVNDAPHAPNVQVGTLENQAFAFDLKAFVSDVETADGDLIFAVATGPSSGLLTSSGPDGAWVYAPNAGFTGVDTIVYEVTDTGDGTSPPITSSGTLTIIVAPINDAPVLTVPMGPVTTPEDTPLGFLAMTGTEISVTDPDIGSGEYEVTLAVNHGTLTLPVGFSVTVIGGANETGSITFTGTETAVNAAFDGLVYTPDADFFGNDTLSILVDDQGNTGAPSNMTDSAAIPIEVTALNDAPVANDDDATTDEDETTTIDILDNDFDVDDSINVGSVLIVSDPINGAVVINADGTVDYTPNANFNGTDSFTYTVKDVTGDTSNVATVTVTVLPVNDAPDVDDDMATIDEDSSTVIDVLANDSDIDGMIDPTSVVIDSGPTNGSVLVDHVTGKITYTPNSNFNGLDTFTYRVADIEEGALSLPALVSVMVNPVNDAPVANPDSYATDEDTVLTVMAPGILDNDTDVDMDSLTAVLIVAPTSGTLNLFSDGAFIYTPAATFNGTVSFSYVAFDGTLASALQTVTIMVNPVNNAPVAVDDTDMVNEDGSVIIDILDNDVDIDAGDMLDESSVDIVMHPMNGTAVENADGTVTYMPNPDFNGTDTFQYTVKDVAGATSNVATVTVTVLPVNDAPVALDDMATTDEDSVLPVLAPGVLANDSDVDPDPLTVSSVGGDAMLVGMPVTLSGGGLVTIHSDGSYTFDPNGQYESLAVGESMTETVNYEVSDGALTATATLTIEITGANDRPTASTASFTTNEDIPLAGTLPAGMDIDANDTLTYQLNTQASNGLVTLNANGTFNYVPNLNFNGPDGFTYFVQDDAGAANSQSLPQFVLINVMSVDDPTLAGNVLLSDIDEDTSLTFTEMDLLANSSDVDDPLSVGSVTLTLGMGTISGSGPWTFTPDMDWNGPVEITFEVVGGTTETAVASLNVNPVDDPTIAGDVSLSDIDEDTSLTFTATDLLANSSDVDDPLSVGSAMLTLGNGTLNFDSGTGSWTFISDPDWNGPVEIAFDVTGSTTDSAVASFMVNPVNDVPTASVSLDPLNVPEDTPQALASFLATTPGGGVDELGQSLTVNVTNDNNGLFSVQPDIDSMGTLTFTPTPATSGTAVVTVTVTDDGTPAESTTVTFTINVGDVTAPTVTGVKIGASTWNAAFQSVIGDVAFPMPEGTGQAVSLPWFGLNDVYVEFSEPVTNVLSTFNISLFGTNSGILIPSSVTLSPGNNVAKLHFDTPLVTDKYLLSVDDAVTDTAGNPLDGEWVNGSSTESGDGAAGGTMQYRFNILVGDYIADNEVNLTDLAAAGALFNLTTADAGYVARRDGNGDGEINLTDLSIAGAYFNANLASIAEPFGVSLPIVSGKGSAHTKSHRFEDRHATRGSAELAAAELSSFDLATARSRMDARIVDEVFGDDEDWADGLQDYELDTLFRDLNR